ncbi:RNA polymerase sigma factor [Brevibacillus sp. B_LB10_24]|uniref:RNA polymerase sigma factor n=1 Tax=Brevibacillus sp. B_LB10_24 TaxID=3380645 RepID=UPI0038BAC20B
MHENFLAMYDEYFGDVYRFVLFKTGNRWDTDDLVSEIFRKAFRKFQSENIEASNLKSWLLTISRHTVIDYYRKRKEVAYGHDPEVYGYTQVSMFFQEADPRNDCLQESLLSLTPDERELMNLKYIVGLKYAEIGEMLSKTEPWLKVKSQRVRQKMAQFINRCMEGER